MGPERYHPSHKRTAILSARRFITKTLSPKYPWDKLPLFKLWPPPQQLTCKSRVKINWKFNRRKFGYHKNQFKRSKT